MFNKISSVLKDLFRSKNAVRRPKNARSGESSFFDLRMKDINGKEFDFSQLRGKKTLIVNTASECGFTPQYKMLEELYLSNKDKLQVLGFPCNDFGGQEPGGSLEIKGFCELRYAITFPMFEKVSIKGKNRSEVYDWLRNPAKNGWNNRVPNWNFCKYLINEKGDLILYANSFVKPVDDEIIKLI
jgi:glutathione peroxidase